MLVVHDPLLSSYSIGLKLRTLRQEKRLTLSQLGTGTGLSTALLSKLESNIMIPTLPTLSKICRTYGIGFGYFFSDVEHHSLAITRRAHLVEERRQKGTTKTTPLHVSSAQGKQLSRLLEITAGATLSISEPGTRTELTAYVLEGSLRVNSAGSDEVLVAGDCIVLDTDAAVVISADRAPCRVLTVIVR